MSDKIKLCESCNTQFDDSCGKEDANTGQWFCDNCWDHFASKAVSASFPLSNVTIVRKTDHLYFCGFLTGIPLFDSHRDEALKYSEGATGPIEATFNKQEQRIQ